MKNYRFFEYGQSEMDWLCSRDSILGAYIIKRGKIDRSIQSDPFGGIIHAITGQQLSNRVHAAIWQRFCSIFPVLQAETIAIKEVAEIQSCGISGSKANCIKQIAAKVISGELPLAEMASWNDEKIMDALSAIRGIGPWTVEMLLIFTFQRKNIFSFGDLALKKGLQKLYGYPQITKEIFERHHKIYSPYGTIAAFYLWDIASAKD